MSQSWMDTGKSLVPKKVNFPIILGFDSRGETGMRNQLLVGYRVFKKIQVRVESGSGPRKTLPENSCITSQVIS